MKEDVQTKIKFLLQIKMFGRYEYETPQEMLERIKEEEYEKKFR